MKRFERDPQSELVRRYARILRSAPAEALRASGSAVGAVGRVADQASEAGRDVADRALRTVRRAPEEPAGRER